MDKVITTKDDFLDKFVEVTLQEEALKDLDELMQLELLTFNMEKTMKGSADAPMDLFAALNPSADPLNGASQTFDVQEITSELLAALNPVVKVYYKLTYPLFWCSKWIIGEYGVKRLCQMHIDKISGRK